MFYYPILKPELTVQKLRGGYYTPTPIAEFLAQWAIRSPQDTVLEPSCGDGSLLIAAAQTLLKHGATSENAAQLLYGIELDPQEAAKTAIHLKALGISDVCVHIGDFFEECQGNLFDQTFFNIVQQEQRQFDVVIGNPPFIRYQNFPESSRQIAFRLMQRVGLHPNRLTNAWLPFLVVSSLLLKKQGRLAMVVPAELFQVNYAAEVRKFLSDFYNQLTMITFEQLVFAGIQQEVVLLLGKRNSSQNGGIHVLELENIADLRSLSQHDYSEGECKPMDHSTEKWTQYYLSAWISPFAG